MTDIYRLADQMIWITSLFGEVHELCAEYRIEAGETDFSVSTAPADIAFEKEKSAREAAVAGYPVPSYTDAYLETLAVYRKIAERMPFYDTVLFHGSCVAVNGEGYLFTAKSGTGKSTHTRLWRKLLGEKAVMVNDDKPLIRINPDGSAVIYGTPWNGKHRLGSNISVPLKAICLLERSEENRIEEVSKMEVYPRLLQQVYRPADRQAMQKTLELIDRLQLRFYRLGCNMDLGAAKLSYETMRAEAPVTMQ